MLPEAQGGETGRRNGVSAGRRAGETNRRIKLCLFDRSSFLALRSQSVIVLGLSRVARFLDMPRRIAQERVPRPMSGRANVTRASQHTPLIPFRVFSRVSRARFLSLGKSRPLQLISGQQKIEDEDGERRVGETACRRVGDRGKRIRETVNGTIRGREEDANGTKM